MRATCLKFFVITQLLIFCINCAPRKHRIREGLADSRQSILHNTIRRLSRRIQHPGISSNVAKLDAYLESFGYLRQTHFGPAHHSELARTHAIRKYQKFNHLPVTGKLDDETRWKMHQPRCGLPDVTSSSRSIRGMRSLAPGTPFFWKKKNLSWRTINFSSDLTPEQQTNTFTQAFKYWSDVTELDFEETSSGKADIEILFGKYNHGDGSNNAFDGNGGTLAHAFLPENGGVHFDDDELWTENSREGTNLKIIATHELGHALGLQHSDKKDSVMTPYYQGYKNNFELSIDDVQDIQAIYGEKIHLEESTEETQGRHKPNICSTSFDTILFSGDNKTYVFNDKWVWRLSNKGVKRSYPKLTRKLFNRPPNSPQAAVFSSKNRRTYFFKDNRVWRYSGNTMESGFPRRLTGDMTKPDAALTDRNGNILLIKNNRVYKLNERTFHVDSNSVLLTEQWQGLPAIKDVRAAMRYNGRYLYFFTEETYTTYDEQDERVIPVYPNTVKHLLGCI